MNSNAPKGGLTRTADQNYGDMLSLFDEKLWKIKTQAKQLEKIKFSWFYMYLQV